MLFNHPSFTLSIDIERLDDRLTDKFCVWSSASCIKTLLTITRQLNQREEKITGCRTGE